MSRSQIQGHKFKLTRSKGQDKNYLNEQNGQNNHG